MHRKPFHVVLSSVAHDLCKFKLNANRGRGNNNNDNWEFPNVQHSIDIDAMKASSLRGMGDHRGGTRWWRLLLLSSSSFPVRLICLSVCLPLGRFCSSGSDSPLTSFFHLSPPSPILPLNRRNRPWKCNFRTNLFPLWLEGRSITGTFVCLVQRKVLRWGSFGICSISPGRQINYKAMPRSKIEVSGWMDHLMVSSWRGTVKYSVLVDVDCDTPRAVQ